MIAAKALGLIFLLATIPLFGLVSRRFIAGQRVRLAALLVWTTNAWMLRWALSGLETALGVFLVLAAVGSWISARESDRDPWGAALLFGLGALVRPECLGLLGLAMIDAVWGADWRRPRRLFVLVAGAGLVLLPWLLYARAVFGHLLPNTVFAKGGSFDLHPSALFRSLRRVLSIVGATSGLEAILVATAGVAGLLKSGAARFGTPWSRRYFLPSAWMVALLGLYVVRSTSLVSRYLLPAICWIVMLGFSAVSQWLDREGNARAGGEPGRAQHRPSAPRPLRRSLLLWILTGCILAQNLVVLYRVNLPGAMRFTRGLQSSLMEIGEWLRSNTPESATVAIPDIGAAGYFSQRRIIDLSGLITPEMLPVNRDYEISDFTRRLAFADVARPDYMVDRSEEANRLAAPGVWPEVCEPILWREIGDLGIARRGSYVYTLYRMHWDRFSPRDPVQ